MTPQTIHTWSKRLQPTTVAKLTLNNDNTDLRTINRSKVVNNKYKNFTQKKVCSNLAALAADLHMKPLCK